MRHIILSIKRYKAADDGETLVIDLVNAKRLILKSSKLLFIDESKRKNFQKVILSILL
jgi:hypothetical protein